MTNNPFETFTNEQKINWQHQLTEEQEQTILSWKPMPPYLQSLVCESKMQKEAVALIGHPLPPNNHDEGEIMYKYYQERGLIS